MEFFYFFILSGLTIWALAMYTEELDDEEICFYRIRQPVSKWAKNILS